MRYLYWMILSVLILGTYGFILRLFQNHRRSSSMGAHSPITWLEFCLLQHCCTWYRYFIVFYVNDCLIQSVVTEVKTVPTAELTLRHIMTH